MRYIRNDDVAGIDYASYLQYLLTVKEDLPAPLYNFASNPRHFDLSSPASLHDAWLESLVVREAATGARHELRQLEVALCLLGPCHDRRIHLAYEGVERYRFDHPGKPDEARHARVAHGDLLTHEVRLGAPGLFVHELLFAGGSTLSIEFSGFSHYEDMLDAKS
jgi:hypothetical protein